MPPNTTTRLEAEQPTIRTYDTVRTWNTQTVEILLCSNEYKAIFEVEVNGDSFGFDAMAAAVEELYQTLPSNDNGTFVELERADGEQALFRDDACQREGWLRPLIVSVRIVGQTKEESVQ